MTPKLKRTLALALAGGTLAIGVPAALAAGGSDAGSGSTAAPSTQIQNQDQQQRPGGREDCPEHEGGQQRGGSSGADSGTANPAPSL